MVKVKEDLTGLKFGRLTVIKQVEDYVSPKGERKSQWLCECDCEDKNQIITTGNLLKRKHTMSCGCLATETKIQNGRNNKKYNTYDLSGKYGIGYTSKGEEFWFDLEDYNKIKDYCWSMDSKGYIVANIFGSNKHGGIKLHRLVMNLPNISFDIDHKHGETSRYDNRKSNLRLATRSQNQMNVKSRKDNKVDVTGVSWDNTRQKWRAYININKQNIHLGYFDEFENAIRARKQGEEKYFGEWSYDNSIN